jgi:hypothetical protein
MKRRTIAKTSRSRRKPSSRKRDSGATKDIDPAELRKRESRFEVFAAAALFVFGIYISILYFGHKVVPISDFPDLFKVGRDILSFRLPTRFMQAPVLGMLQFILSKFVGGQHPPLTAGWLLNAMLYPFSLILLWLIGKRVIGKSALWMAIAAMISPWVIYMLTEPIVETTLLFFTLLTYYFMFKRSKWCYLFASITTMVRYEGAALIFAAFVMDMIYSESKRERIWAFVYSAAASVPLALWLSGTFLTWDPSTGHYFRVWTKEYAKTLSQPVENRTGLVLHMQLLWRVGFQPLLSAYPTAGAAGVKALWKLTMVFAAVGFSFGSVYALCKRKWNVLALLIFFVPYFVLHATYPYPLTRYHTNL